MTKLITALSFSIILSLYRVLLCKCEVVKELEQASLPPRGWNSYDSFCWTISEEEFLQNAQLVAKRLHSHGYQYVVVDYLWYRRKVKGAYVDSLGFDVIDEWGRMIPDPGRWPSSRGGKGFTEVAKKVHNMGLKFGIHIMNGISTQAVNANTPILDIKTGRAYEEYGRKWYARDIGIKERACPWMTHGFMSVNIKLGAAKAFLRSLYQQYAEWGVDFVKHDCVFGQDLDFEEISFASQVWRELNRPILYSLSPGSSVTPTMAKDISGLVNMYRITGDDWDSWKDIASHFDISRDFSAANMIGAKGLYGKSWPDLDMLPLGWLTDQGVNQGPHRKCNLTLTEQRTQMTLWSMAKSPLMFGGDMRKLDDTTFNLITNPTLLDINSFSSHNREFPYVTDEANLHTRNQGPPFLRSQQDPGVPKSLAWRMISCKDVEANSWFNIPVDDTTELVCWKGDSGNKYQAPFCLNKREPLSATDEEMMYKQKYQRNFHLLTDKREFCLNASPRRRRTSKEISRGSFSPCRWDTNQLWELNYNGTLVSSYSGLCASMYTVKADAIPRGVRSWIATGRKGEIFVAFFNLNPEKTVISAKISDLSKGLPLRNSEFSSCSGREIWSGKHYGGIKRSLSISVQKHGCALFVLSCK